MSLSLLKSCAPSQGRRFDAFSPLPFRQPASHYIPILPLLFPLFTPLPLLFFLFLLTILFFTKKKKEKTATQAFVKTLSKPKLNINFLSPLKLLKNGEGHFWNTKNSAEAPAHGDSSVHTPYGGRIT